MSEAELLALVDALPWEEWSRTRFGPGFLQLYRDLVIRTGAATAEGRGGTWSNTDPYTTTVMTEYVGARIVQLEQTARRRVIAVLRQVIAANAGQTPREIGDLVRQAVLTVFAEYAQWRADRIARTETAIAQNHGTILGIAQTGGRHVDVTDGTDDAVCAAANGQRWTIAHALANPLGHPNCTRVFSPVPEDFEE